MAVLDRRLESGARGLGVFAEVQGRLRTGRGKGSGHSPHRARTGVYAGEVGGHRTDGLSQDTLLGISPRPCSLPGPGAWRRTGGQRAPSHREPCPPLADAAPIAVTPH